MAESKMVKWWFKYAARDLKIAKLSLENSSDLKNISAFHSQQCAEKAIKGLLASHKIRFSKTHKIDDLAKELISIDSKFSKRLMKYKNMNDLAVAYRYPDAEKKPLTISRAKTAIKNAETIYNECFKKASGTR